MSNYKNIFHQYKNFKNISNGPCINLPWNDDELQFNNFNQSLEQIFEGGLDANQTEPLYLIFVLVLSQHIFHTDSGLIIVI